LRGLRAPEGRERAAHPNIRWRGHCWKANRPPQRDTRLASRRNRVMKMVPAEIFDQIRARI
jgi:hypothetical protein